MKDQTKDKDFIKAAHYSVVELISTGNWVQDHISEILKPFKISNPQFNVLRILRGQKGQPASLSCVSEKMIHKMSNTTRLVDKLMEKGLVDRIICPENRRKVEITITEDGLTLLQKIDGILEKTETQLMSGLEQAELEELQRILLKIKE